MADVHRTLFRLITIKKENELVPLESEPVARKGEWRVSQVRSEVPKSF